MSLWNPTNGDAGTQQAGSVVRTGGAPNTVVLAQADTTAHADNIVGVRLADILTTDTGPVAPLEPGVLVRLAAEPAIDDVIYLSATVAGEGTNVATPVKLGICYEKQSIGGVWFARLVSVSLGALAAVSAPLVALANAYVRTVNPQTGTTYVLALADREKDGRALVTLANANPVTVTVPKNSVVAFALGDSINLQQTGAGKVTFAPVDGDVVINPAATLSISAQWKAASLVQTAANVWSLIGALSA